MTASVLPIQADSQQTPQGRLLVTEKRLREFVAKQLERLPLADSLVLYHEDAQGQDGKPVVIHVHKVDRKRKDNTSQESPSEAITKDILALASCHCDSFGGAAQRYRLASEKGGEGLQSHFFGLGEVVRPAVVENHSAEKFLMQQLKEQSAQLREMHKLVVDLVTNVSEPIQSLSQQNARLNAEVLTHFERRVQQYELTETLIDRKAERDLVRTREERAQARRDKAVDKLLEKVAPLVIGHLAGKITGITGDATAAATGEPKQIGASPIAEAQAFLRRAFKIVGREALVTSLKPEFRHVVDDLVGLGDDPKDMAELKRKLMIVWGEVPEEVSEAMQQKILAEPDGQSLMAKFLELASIQEGD